MTDKDWIEWKDTDCLLKVQLQAEGKYMEKERRDTDSFLRQRMQRRGKLNGKGRILTTYLKMQVVGKNIERKMEGY